MTTLAAQHKNATKPTNIAKHTNIMKHINNIWSFYQNQKKRKKSKRKKKDKKKNNQFFISILAQININIHQQKCSFGATFQYPYILFFISEILCINLHSKMNRSVYAEEIRSLLRSGACRNILNNYKIKFKKKKTADRIFEFYQTNN